MDDPNTLLAQINNRVLAAENVVKQLENISKQLEEKEKNIIEKISKNDSDLNKVTNKIFQVDSIFENNKNDFIQKVKSDEMYKKIIDDETNQLKGEVTTAKKDAVNAATEAKKYADAANEVLVGANELNAQTENIRKELNKDQENLKAELKEIDNVFKTNADKIITQTQEIKNETENFKNETKNFRDETSYINDEIKNVYGQVNVRSETVETVLTEAKKVSQDIKKDLSTLTEIMRHGGAPVSTTGLTTLSPEIDVKKIFWAVAIFSSLGIISLVIYIVFVVDFLESIDENPGDFSSQISYTRAMEIVCVILSTVTFVLSVLIYSWSDKNDIYIVMIFATGIIQFVFCLSMLSVEKAFSIFMNGVNQDLELGHTIMNIQYFLSSVSLITNIILLVSVVLIMYKTKKSVVAPEPTFTGTVTNKKKKFITVKNI